MKPIKNYLNENRIPCYLLADPSLSGGERAQAIITTALISSWDSLDGRQQRAIVTALKQSTQATENAEAWATEQIAGTDTRR